MATLIFTILIVYLLWLVIGPWLRRLAAARFERKVNDFINQQFGAAREQYSRAYGYRAPREPEAAARRGKKINSDVGEYVEFTEIEGTFPNPPADPGYTPREPQVSDAEWEDVK